MMLSPAIAGNREYDSIDNSGLVKISVDGGNQWMYMCGDAWSGWNHKAADTVCRQLGHAGGGDAMLAWRTGWRPSMMLGHLDCKSTDKSLSACSVFPVPGKVDEVKFNVPPLVSLAVCKKIAAVKCRHAPSSLAIRVASTPAGSGVNVTDRDTKSVAFVARLEVRIGNAEYRAVCADDGFDNSSATVACRALGYNFGGSAYYSAPLTSRPGDIKADAAGSYLGSLTSVSCAGTEADFKACAAYRAPDDGNLVPCKAAAWVACNTGKKVAATSASR
ncbi:hypothetical protein HYH03_018278 [Edaphochlamys debaryana]|uniref:SRCR domain-containing protein n=1 Tax=Edaphochlamys debaryana TaxID=47281 RepID=A0A835XIB9_9CHLO|nr:hypothetical protein HYH03_018278 [Edaphochlamys debaryana]|eukprot:KAG2482841.1 hypothetical protein HYH03_018278 [Edaphochlamys debaryana]